MKSTATMLWARVMVWTMVTVTLVAVLRGAHWGWMMAALGLALAADIRDLARWPSRKTARG